MKPSLNKFDDFWFGIASPHYRNSACIFGIQEEGKYKPKSGIRKKLFITIIALSCQTEKRFLQREINAANMMQFGVTLIATKLKWSLREKKTLVQVQFSGGPIKKKHS